ncbi:Carbonyl reductase [NADPH] [Trichoderma ghanense]|uniref:Carbonyl reductase [NADPH] n=1 Tax=Trichoderma ghanense TaxID=65468 RepID=A0ABY2HIB9_9HYPO
MPAVLITGANRGIGFGIAQAVASRIPSCTIILGCRKTQNGHEAIERLRELGVSSPLGAVQIDIEDTNSITAAVETLDKTCGKLDVLINNAASLQLPKTQHLAELKDCSNRTFNSCHVPTFS